MRRLLASLAVALAVGTAPGAGIATAGPGRAARVTRTGRPSATRAAAARERARRLQARRRAPRPDRLIIDVGGEGRHPRAINLNPGRFTSTTGQPGRPIPRHVQGVGERMPFASRLADVLRVENAPLRRGAAAELARVIKPGGRIVLRHPSDYAATHHGEVIRRVGGSHRQGRADGMTITVIRAPPAN